MSEEYQRLQEDRRPLVKAIYHDQLLVDYRGNPLIEALPPMLEAEEAYDKLCLFPPYDEGERFLSPEIRFHALYRVQHFFQPIIRHLELEQKFSRLLRTGYLHRNPLDPSQVQQVTGQPAPNVRSSASSLTFMGFSGIGKTTAVERVLSLYPQCILHEEPVSRVQIVWLKLNCPHDGTLKSLCMDFFLKIDDLIGTNYYQKYGHRRNSISAMVSQMGRVARLHCIGALIIDEIQHLLTAKDKGSEKMMNFFVTLINEVGIPIMLIGTMRARTVLQQDFRQARRGSGQGDMVWEQMQNDHEWEMFMQEMWRYQWTRERVPLTEEISQTIYEESQGIVDIAVKLYSLTQGRSIVYSHETISPALIRQVAREDLKLVQPMLNALKSGLMSEIQKYEDIMPMGLADCLQVHQSKIDLRATIQKKKEQQEKARQAYETSIAEKAILALIGLDIDPKKAEKAVLHVLKGKGEKSQSQVVVQALAYIEEKEQREKVPRNESRLQSVLATCIEKGKRQGWSAYESLKESGFIGEPLQEFAI
ncbi:ATP-binding protein [Tumebacillus lipolyticus]|uniref:ATP-binding protein n=1 Tax=Tumebacillus lipolyticus TaxID=1280370 RepID=A0ABW4ZVS1_9BACL